MEATERKQKCYSPESFVLHWNTRSLWVVFLLQIFDLFWDYRKADEAFSSSGHELCPWQRIKLFTDDLEGAKDLKPGQFSVDTSLDSPCWSLCKCPFEHLWWLCWVSWDAQHQFTEGGFEMYQPVHVEWKHSGRTRGLLPTPQWYWNNAQGSPLQGSGSRPSERKSN